MPTKEKVIPTILIVGTTYSLLTDSADKLNKILRVRVAETRDTVISYLRCMKFDLVVIEHTVSKDIVSAVVNAVPQETAIFYPEKSMKTQTIVNEVTRRFEGKYARREE